MEYENLCRQIYQQAWQEIKKQSSKAEGKLAIVVDLDGDGSEQQLLSGGSMGKRDGFYAGILVRVGKSEESGFDTGSKTFLDRTRTLGGDHYILEQSECRVISYRLLRI